MHELNYRHLLYFHVVAREGSVAAATRVLGVAQPTISGQLRLLEEALGERLLTRSGRGVKLTEMGHLVARHAEAIFALGEELLDTVKGRPTSGPVRFAVGLSDSLPKLTTWRLLRPALQQSEPLRLLVRIGKTEQLLTELSLRGLDLVLADAPINPGVTVRAFNHLLGECPVTVFGAPPLQERFRRGFPGSLAGAPFILPTSNTTLRRSLDGWFETQGFRPVIVAEVEDVALAQVLGGDGLGLFAAPSVVESEIRRQYAVLPVGRLDAVRERFYAISIDRTLRHPAVVAISRAARTQLFS